MDAILRLVPRVARIPWMTRRYASVSNKEALPDELIIPMDRDMIVCWHPEKLFPYKYSLPLPVEQVESPNQSKYLRVGQKEVQAMFHKEMDQNLFAQQLGKLTYTTKHRWFPKKRIYKSKKTPPNRPYL